MLPWSVPRRRSAGKACPRRDGPGARRGRLRGIRAHAQRSLTDGVSDSQRKMNSSKSWGAGAAGGRGLVSFSAIEQTSFSMGYTAQYMRGGGNYVSNIREKVSSGTAFFHFGGMAAGAAGQTNPG